VASKEMGYKAAEERQEAKDSIFSPQLHRGNSDDTA
jgi:hypothetical protein